MQKLLGRSRLPGGLFYWGRVVLLLNRAAERTLRLPLPLLGVQLPAGMCECLVPLLQRNGDPVHAAAPLR